MGLNRRTSTSRIPGALIPTTTRRLREALGRISAHERSTAKLHSQFLPGSFISVTARSRCVWRGGRKHKGTWHLSQNREIQSEELKDSCLSHPLPHLEALWQGLRPAAQTPRHVDGHVDSLSPSHFVVQSIALLGEVPYRDVLGLHEGAVLGLALEVLLPVDAAVVFP